MAQHEIELTLSEFYELCLICDDNCYFDYRKKEIYILTNLKIDRNRVISHEHYYYPCGDLFSEEDAGYYGKTSFSDELIKSEVLSRLKFQMRREKIEKIIDKNNGINI